MERLRPMTKEQEAEHQKLLAKWARGTLNRAGILRCMVLSKIAERAAEDAFATKFAARPAAEGAAGEWLTSTGESGD